MTTAQRPPSTRLARAWRLGIPALAAVLLLGTGAAFLVFGQEAPPMIYGYQVVKTYPHAADSFCQGLVFHEGRLLEGSGLYGQSTLREVELETGKVLRSIPLPANVFGEGIALWDGQILQLTWENRVGFVYDLKTFRQTKRFRYTGEGWGLTHDGKNLILSDGTSTLRFLDPKTYRVTRRLRVTDQGRPIDQLNELEYIDGEIYANIWNTDYIVRINPANGRVNSWIDLAGLLPQHERPGTNAVLNGIAHDPATKRLFVTGKNWPKLFEIRLVPPAR